MQLAQRVKGLHRDWREEEDSAGEHFAPNSSGDTNKNCLYLGSCSVGGARHSGAPMLRRYAATSDFLLSMAHLRAVLPHFLVLQGR
jgi:hypothetical protein